MTKLFFLPLLTIPSALADSVEEKAKALVDFAQEEVQIKAFNQCAQTCNKFDEKKTDCVEAWNAVADCYAVCHHENVTDKFAAKKIDVVRHEHCKRIKVEEVAGGPKCEKLDCEKWTPRGDANRLMAFGAFLLLLL